VSTALYSGPGGRHQIYNISDACKWLLQLDWLVLSVTRTCMQEYINEFAF